MSLRLIFVFLFCLSPIEAQHTYYVSKSAGADTNTSTQAQVKTTPWAHSPGMAGCASNCGTYTPVAGDTFIFKGCDTWLSADLPISWTISGSSGSPIKFTVDQTWFNTSVCPSTWNRPIFNDASGTVFSPNFMFNADVSLVSWLTIDNIEWQNSTCTGACSGLSSYIACDCTNLIVSNNYFHKLNYAADNSCIVAFGAGADATNLVTQNVFDGSDATNSGTGSGICSGPLPNATKNVIHDMPNGIRGGAASGAAVITLDANHIYNIVPSLAGANHINFIEFLDTVGATYIVKNNYLHDQINGASGAEGVAICNGGTGETAILYNNVFYQSGDVISVDARGNPCTNFVYNNTIVPTPGGTCVNQTGSAINPTITIENNHCITTGALQNITGSPTVTTNLLQTPTQANANSSPHFDQYSNSQSPFVWAPVASTNSTVGAGTNLTSIATGNLSGLVNDTSYACTQQTVSGVVQAVCPTRTATSRPGSGVWDIGAYEFSSASVPNGARASWLFTMLVDY